jgi:type IV fimbrial biogenesis protein FimT
MVTEPRGRRQAAGVQRGFSLMELVITVVILAILAMIALPNFRSAMRRNHVSAQVNSLLADLQFARSEAVTTRSLVSICPRAAGDTPACAAAGTGVFDAGWLVYTATEVGTNFDGTKTGQTLLHTNATPDNVSIRALNGTTILTLNARGELSTGTDVDFAICAKPSPGQGDAGESTAQVPGKLLSLAAGGRAASSNMASAAACE